MSLSDYLKYLRATKGGLTPWEIAEASGVPARDIHLIEVKHRRVGENDAQLERLAGYFGVPVEDFTGRREAYRKRLTVFVEESKAHDTPVTIRLENGEEFSGKIAWFGREALALQPEDEQDPAEPIVVQRPWIADWRRSDTIEWEVRGGA